MSNDIIKTPTAELVGEYEKASGLTLELKMQYKKATTRKLTKEYIDALTNRIAEFEQVMNIVGPELDRRCEAAGISIIGERFVFSGLEIAHDSQRNPIGHYHTLPASELHALLGWLMKDK